MFQSSYLSINVEVPHENVYMYVYILREYVSVCVCACARRVCYVYMYVFVYSQVPNKRGGGRNNREGGKFLKKINKRGEVGIF